MKVPVTLASLALITLSISACSESAQQETSEAADAVGQDLERTGEAAVQATQDAAQSAKNAASDVASDVRAGADAAADETGAALEEAGQRLQD